MAKRRETLATDLAMIGAALDTLGRTGVYERPIPTLRNLLDRLLLVQDETRPAPESAPADRLMGRLVATNRLFSLGPVRTREQAIRRASSLHPQYRSHLIRLLLPAIQSQTDDRSLGAILERLDHLGPELLLEWKNPSCSTSDVHPWFPAWDREIWQSPDGVTLLSQVVTEPGDLPLRQSAATLWSAEGGRSIVPVGFGWLWWGTPPAEPHPAPTSDRVPLGSPFQTVEHPFWGALVATLDACTGDYPWQSLVLRGPTVRSRHRTLGHAESQLAELWRAELGLYPAMPLIEERLIPGRPLAWLQPALDEMNRVGAATLTEGTWRLTDAFRTQLMRDDEHMLAFEAVRRRSFRLAQAAEHKAGL